MTNQSFSLWSNIIQLVMIFIVIISVVKLSTKYERKIQIYTKILVTSFMYQFARDNIIFLLNGIYKTFYNTSLKSQSLLLNKNILQVKNNWLGAIISSNGLLEIVTLAIYVVIVLLLFLVFRNYKHANVSK